MWAPVGGGEWDYAVMPYAAYHRPPRNTPIRLAGLRSGTHGWGQEGGGAHIHQTTSRPKESPIHRLPRPRSGTQGAGAAPATHHITPNSMPSRAHFFVLPSEAEGSEAVILQNSRLPRLRSGTHGWARRRVLPTTTTPDRQALMLEILPEYRVFATLPVYGEEASNIKAAEPAGRRRRAVGHVDNRMCQRSRAHIDACSYIDPNACADRPRLHRPRHPHRRQRRPPRRHRLSTPIPNPYTDIRRLSPRRRLLSP